MVFEIDISITTVYVTVSRHLKGRYTATTSDHCSVSLQKKKGKPQNKSTDILLRVQSDLISAWPVHTVTVTRTELAQRRNAWL